MKGGTIKRRIMKRRSILAALAALTLAGAAPAYSQPAKPDKIVIAAYGGIWADSVRKNFIPCFEQKTGVKVEVITGESADWLARIRANPTNPPIHVVALAEADSLRAAKEGLLEQATVQKLPNLADIPDPFHKPWNDYSVAQNIGDVGKAMAGAVTKVEATYQVPFLAHATMEPMNCTVHVRRDGCEVWVGTQVAARAQAAAAKTTGLPLDKVVVHNHLIGGGFGRRLEIDGVIRAVEIAKQVDGPVKVVWTREEDIQHDMYRP